jgi:hypothetical protein
MITLTLLMQGRLQKLGNSQEKLSVYKFQKGAWYFMLLLECYKIM